MVSVSHGIIGAAGDMGTSLGRLLPTDTVGVDGPDSDRAALSACDVIWLAIPREAVGAELIRHPPRPAQLVIDICSIKRGVSKLITSTGATHLSLHPMHGPNIRRDRQKWFRIGPRNQTSDIANDVLSYLESLGITFLEAESEEDHDFKMGIVLGLKEVLTLVTERLIADYASACGKATPSIDALLAWSSPVANAIHGAYVHSVLSSSSALRRELVAGADGKVIASASTALKALAGELAEFNLEEKFANQRSRIEGALSQNRQIGISRNINSWFEDATVTSTQALIATLRDDLTRTQREVASLRDQLGDLAPNQQ